MLVHFLLPVDDGAYHLLFVGADGRHGEVELHLWCVCHTADVHQAVNADGVAGERAPDVEVGERYAIDGVLGLQVELGVEGCSAEDHRTTVLEGKVLLDELLYGDVVRAFADGVGAKHLHASLIIIVRAYGTAAVQGDVVACLRIHKQADGCLWSAADDEVQEDVGCSRCEVRGTRFEITLEGRNIGRSILVSRISYLVPRTFPRNEFLIGNGIGRAHVIDEDRVLAWGGINVEGNASGTSLNGNAACAIDGAVERF